MNKVLILPKGFAVDDIRQCLKPVNLSSFYKVGQKLFIYGEKHEYILETEINHIDCVEIRSTDMSLNGQQLYSTLHDRDAPITYNEFAENCGYESFMKMSKLLNATDDKPFVGNVIYWN